MIRSHKTFLCYSLIIECFERGEMGMTEGIGEQQSQGTVVLGEDARNFNTTFYTYLKRLYGEYKFKPQRYFELIEQLLERKEAGHSLQELADYIIEFIDDVLGNMNTREKTIEEYKRLFFEWDDESYLEMFIVALYLIDLKIIIDEKIKQNNSNIELEGHPLSLTYDNASTIEPYLKRVNAIIISEEMYKELLELDEGFQLYVTNLTAKDVRVLSIFHTIMAESISQSIRSSSGAGYEKRIHNFLLEIGIPDASITEYSHEDVGSIEHDFKIDLNGRKYGISAKRTLRERYKQYVNLLEQEENLDVDILMTITLGTDLGEAKARTIRGFGVYIFVAPEIYEKYAYLQGIEGVYSINELTVEILQTL